MKSLAVLTLLLPFPSVCLAMGNRPPTDPATYSDIQSVQGSVSEVQGQVIRQSAKEAADNSAQGSANADTSRRVDQLEQMKALLETDVRLYDGKKIQVAMFNMVDVAHGSEFGAGVRLTYKMGKSYEERQIEELRREIEGLRGGHHANNINGSL